MKKIAKTLFQLSFIWLAIFVFAALLGAGVVAGGLGIAWIVSLI